MQNDPLYQLCRKFISENNINCPETIYQTDHVIRNAYEFIEGICDIVGYPSSEDDEEEE